MEEKPDNERWALLTDQAGAMLGTVIGEMSEAYEQSPIEWRQSEEGIRLQPQTDALLRALERLSTLHKAFHADVDMPAIEIASGY